MTDHTANPEGWIPPLNPEQYAARMDAYAAAGIVTHETHAAAGLADQTETTTGEDFRRAQAAERAHRLRPTRPHDDPRLHPSASLAAATAPVAPHVEPTTYTTEALEVARAHADAVDDALELLHDTLGILEARLAPVTTGEERADATAYGPDDVSSTPSTAGTSPLVAALDDLIYRADRHADQLGRLTRHVRRITDNLEV